MIKNPKMTMTIMKIFQAEIKKLLKIKLIIFFLFQHLLILIYIHVFYFYPRNKNFEATPALKIITIL